MAGQDDRRGCSSVGRASAFQAEGRGFEPRRPLAGLARVAQLVEHILGKDEVTGSIPVASSETLGWSGGRQCRVDGHINKCLPSLIGRLIAPGSRRMQAGMWAPGAGWRGALDSL